MSSAGFEYPAMFAGNVPAPGARWAGFPRYNFVGGHNDADLIPSEGLAEAAAAVLRLCFALPPQADIRDGVAAFARVCAEQAGIPARSANVATRGG